MVTENSGDFIQQSRGPPFVLTLRNGQHGVGQSGQDAPVCGTLLQLPSKLIENIDAKGDKNCLYDFLATSPMGQLGIWAGQGAVLCILGGGL